MTRLVLRQGASTLAERVVSAHPPTVTLQTPNGGEVIPEGSFYTIRWGAPATAETFNLALSINGGSTWRVIDQGVVDSSFVWQAPPVTTTRTNCRIRVRGYSATNALLGADISNGSFTIQNVP